MGTHKELFYKNKLKCHLDGEKIHRLDFYGNRALSISKPHNLLTIIHNKMDHAKMALPLFSHKTKMNDAWMKLSIAVIGMIVHGHGDVKYAHYGVDIYLHDCNHTIGSIAKLLCDLESILFLYSTVLFHGPGASLLFQSILEGKQIFVRSLLPHPTTRGFASLMLSELVVQLDNATSHNKNKYMFYFWSLLVAQGVLREIWVNFLLVGHTHNDIDTLFGRWSMKLRSNDYPTIPLLMKSFMDVESQPLVPHFIEEVYDFKGFIEGCIATGDEELVGHSKG